LLLDVAVGKGRAQSDAEVAEANEAIKNDRWMGWKYVPNIDGKGAAVSHPTLIGREITVAESWIGEGRISYGDVTGETHPWSGDIVAALRTLEIKQYRSGSVAHGSMTITRALNRVLA